MRMDWASRCHGFAITIVTRMSMGRMRTRRTGLRAACRDAESLSTFEWVWPVVRPGLESPGLLKRNPKNLGDRTLGQAVILKCDSNGEHTNHAGERNHDPRSEEFLAVVYSMGGHRRGASLVACRADDCGRAVYRPADNRGAHAAALAGLDSPHAVSRTLQIHSAQPNLGGSAARG